MRKYGYIYNITLMPFVQIMTISNMVLFKNKTKGWTILTFNLIVAVPSITITLGTVEVSTIQKDRYLTAMVHFWMLFKVQQCT